jgi:hypothetical protein
MRSQFGQGNIAEAAIEFRPGRVVIGPTRRRLARPLKKVRIESEQAIHLMHCQSAQIQLFFDLGSGLGHQPAGVDLRSEGDVVHQVDDGTLEPLGKSMAPRS